MPEPLSPRDVEQRPLAHHPAWGGDRNPAARKPNLRPSSSVWGPLLRREVAESLLPEVSELFAASSVRP